jgi:hypothetical protein
LQRRAETVHERLARADAAHEEALKVRIAELEEALELQKRAVESPKASLTPDRRIQELLTEWENWGRRTYSNVTQGEIFRDNSRALRRTLGEMIVGVVDQGSLHRKVRSLRDQKAIMRSGKPLAPTGKEEPTLWTIVIIGIALTRMRHDLALPIKK